MFPSTKAVLAALLILGGAAIVWAAARPSDRKSLVAGKRVLLIGDSMAEGLEEPLRGMFAQQGITYDASAERNTRIAQWAGSSNRLSVIDAFRPDVVLVSLGTNDAALLHPSDERDELELLVSRIANSGARVVWLEPPSIESLPRLSEVRSMIRHSKAIVESGAVILDPSSESFDRSHDGIHLTENGYSTWAQWIWTQISGSTEA